MALSSLANYRNLLLATNAYKNEGVARFFGYTGHNGRVLEAKECFVFQDSFVHPQGVLARTALLRDVANNNVKYGSGDILFYSTTVTQAAAGTSYTCQAPGRILGLFVDNLFKGNGQAVDLQTTMNSGSAATILSSTYVIPSVGLEAYDASANLLGHAGSAYVSGTPTIAAPATGQNATPVIATGVFTMAGGVPFVAGDGIIFTALGTVTGLTVTTVTYYIGALTATTFKVYATSAAAIAGGNDHVVLGGTAAATTFNPAIRADGGAATATATFVAESGSSISANNGKPVRFTIINGGCGYVTAPSITYPSGVGSNILTKTYLASGRVTAIDVMHPCDVLPGTVISFPNTGFTATGSSARITVAIANFSA